MIRDTQLVASQFEVFLMDKTIRETVIGNRGSKSVVLLVRSTIVKEQRVDGS